MSAQSQTDFDLYKSQGFLKIPGAIESSLLRKLYDLFEILLQHPSAQDYVVLNNGEHNYVTNIINLCHRGNLACLELLGHPLITGIARQFCGPDFFSLQEFAVIKNLGDENPVLWHQDLLYPMDKGICLNIGIYLDEVGPHDGALRVVPGSHRSNRDICTLKQEDSLEIPMQAGDILVHDMRLAHSSRPLREKALRRVIYFEFMPSRLMLELGMCNELEIKTRQELAELAADYYQQLNGPAANSNADSPELRARLNQIYHIPIRHFPSTYCLE